MRFYFPPQILLEDLRGFTEIFFLIPYLNTPLYLEVLKRTEWHNEGLFSSLFFNKPAHEKVSLEECDYVLLPFKYDQRDPRVEDVCNQALAFDKKVIAFYCDDSEQIFELPKNLILFRSSTTRSLIQSSERIFPALVADYYPHFKPFPKQKENDKVGYCGRDDEYRKSFLVHMQKMGIEVDAVYTGPFWGTRTDWQQKLLTKKQFHENLLNNQFILCVRGAGNFSYRFYESLSFARIPILIDTDVQLPFENCIDWSRHIIKIKEEEMSVLPSLIKECNIDPSSNRSLWEKYFSPSGYSLNFVKDL